MNVTRPRRDVTTLPRPVKRHTPVVWGPLRWPRTIGLLAQSALLAPVLALVLAIVAVDVVVATYQVYERAYNRGLREGQAQGVVAVCGALADQARWATNVERDLVTSKQDTPATGSAVNQTTQASLHYACAASGSRVAGNIYEPPARPSPVPSPRASPSPTPAPGPPQKKVP